MMSKNIPTIIIAGPTASGKTKLSLELAKNNNGEIINADIMQMYEGFNILKQCHPQKKNLKLNIIYSVS